MARGIEARLAALESAFGADKGLRHFATVNLVDYFEVGPGYSYVDALLCADGHNPTGRPSWAQAELDALTADGWQVIVVHWVSDWRGTDER